MRAISYKAKHRLRVFLKILLILLGIALVVGIFAFIYLQRFIVYTTDGAKLDFNKQTGKASPGTSVSVTVPQDDVHIVTEATQEKTDDEFHALTGYYISTSMLQNPTEVYNAVKALKEPTTVLIDLKSDSGRFYYSTDLAGVEKADSNIISAVEAILAYLKENNFTVIARIQSFRDSNRALENQRTGISIAINGGYLWSDSGYYWLDPGFDQNILYVEQIIKDLAAKGIREIVLDDFYFPESTKIVYKHSESTAELMNNVAKSISDYYNSTSVTVSFGNPTQEFSLTGYDYRLFLDTVDASKVGAVMKGYKGLSVPEEQVVFLTGSKDTRFDGYNILRPLLQEYNVELFTEFAKADCTVRNGQRCG